MKRLLIAVFLMCAMLTASTLSLVRLKHVKDSMMDGLDQLVYLAQTEQYEQAYIQSELLFEQWDEQEDRLIRYLRHTDLDSISSQMARLSYLIKYKDPAEFLSEVSEIRHLILHLWESELPLPRNIL